MEPTDEQALDAIRRHLLKSRGLDLSGYSKSFVMRAIRKRMGRTKVNDLLSYVGLVRRSDEETNELLGALSINVTEFFRDEGAFEAFSEKVLRPLLAAKAEGSGGVTRIWSAGCATGQEPYTLAICVEEELRRLGSCNAIVSVLGTDLSEHALDKARAGVFTAAQMKNLPEKYRKQYFLSRADGFEVSDIIRRRVRFAQENLLDKPSSKFFDAVVCRNVMIYFSRTMHDKVMENLYEALRPEGYIMLGRTETLMGAPRSKFLNIDPENRIFKKVK